MPDLMHQSMHNSLSGNIDVEIKVRDGKCFLYMPGVMDPIVINDGWGTTIKIEVPGNISTPVKVEAYVPWARHVPWYDR